MEEELVAESTSRGRVRETRQPKRWESPNKYRFKFPTHRSVEKAKLVWPPKKGKNSSFVYKDISDM